MSHGGYTNERNKLIIISLLKKYGIKKIVVSPGATNFALVGSLQNDSFFEIYSCVDERAAAYMAIGMAQKSKEPVAISCTGATSSRNYMSALTYAFKNDIPILVITSSLSLASVGHLKAQVTDREHPPVDMIYKSYQFDNIKDKEDEWKTIVKCNEALSNLFIYRKPILINVCTNYSLNFGVKQLPEVKYIPTYQKGDTLPSLPYTNIGVFIGSHALFSEEGKKALEEFCEANKAVVFCDHTSGYNGKYKINMALPFAQEYYTSKNREVGLLIHIGEISGDYYTFGGLNPKEVWRVNADGAYSDFFKKLSAVFKMEEQEFFSHFSKRIKTVNNDYFNSCKKECEEFKMLTKEVPFSNLWIASQLHDKLPEKSQIHFGILNSLRAWDFFDLPLGIESKCNVGGFGIDGCVSSLIGAAWMSPNKLFIGVVGDLAFYYDSNILLNKNLPKNFVLIIVNNGLGIEFRNYCHPASLSLGNNVEPFIAAKGHFGNKINSAVKELCKKANIEYYPVLSKEDFNKIIANIISSRNQQPLIVECFTESVDESEALRIFRQLKKDSKRYISKLKSVARAIKNKVG